MQVFISHSVAGKDLARKVAEVLNASGFQAWDWSYDLFPGDNWGEELGRALKSSEAMVVLLTSDFPQSPFVQSEISYALGQLQYEGRVIPVIAAPPEELPPDKVPWILNRFHPINLLETGPEEGLQRIAQALRQAA